MTPEQESKRRYWKLAINRLCIGDTTSANGIAVTRASRNRYVVTVNGVTFDVGGRAATVLTAATKALSVIRVNAIDGQEEIYMCVQCETRPRVRGRAYCRECEYVLDQGYNQTYYQKLKARKEQAA